MSKPVLTKPEEVKLANAVNNECLQACNKCCKALDMHIYGYLHCALQAIDPGKAPEKCAVVTLQNAMRDLQRGIPNPTGLKASSVKLAAIQALIRGEQPLEAVTDSKVVADDTNKAAAEDAS